MTSGVLRYRIYANYRQKINSYITFSKAFCRMMYNEWEYVIIETAAGWSQISAVNIEYS